MNQTAAMGWGEPRQRYCHKIMHCCPKQLYIKAFRLGAGERKRKETVNQRLHVNHWRATKLMSFPSLNAASCLLLNLSHCYIFSALSMPSSTSCRVTFKPRKCETRKGGGWVQFRALPVYVCNMCRSLLRESLPDVTRPVVGAEHTET
jgi:hypothetical protein